MSVEGPLRHREAGDEHELAVLLAEALAAGGARPGLSEFTPDGIGRAGLAGLQNLFQPGIKSRGLGGSAPKPVDSAWQHAVPLDAGADRSRDSLCDPRAGRSHGGVGSNGSAAIMANSGGAISPGWSLPYGRGSD